MSIGTGNINTHQKKEPSGPPFVPASARNGASVQGGVIEWGQPQGTGPGGPADLIHSTEIPMAGFDVDFIQDPVLLLRITGVGNALQWHATGDPSIPMISQSAGGSIVFSDAGTGQGNVWFNLGSTGHYGFGNGNASLGGFMTMIDNDPTRNVGCWFRQAGTFAGTWSGYRIQNSDAGNTSRTQFEAINNGFLNAGVVLGIGAVANTIYPNTSYLSVGSVGAGLFIVSRNAAGFVAWSIGAEGTAGEVMRLVAGGRLGIGVTAATARVHPAAGVAGVSGAPFKYNAGVAAQTAVENGAKNFDGTNETLAAGGVTYIIKKCLTATANLDFPNTAAQTSFDLNIAVAGAALLDPVTVGIGAALQIADTCVTAFVSAAGVVTVRFNNYSAGAIDPGAADVRVTVEKLV